MQGQNGHIDKISTQHEQLPSLSPKIVTDNAYFYRQMINDLRQAQGLQPRQRNSSYMTKSIRKRNGVLESRVIRQVQYVLHILNRMKYLSNHTTNIAPLAGLKSIETILYQKYTTSKVLPKYPSTWIKESLTQYISKLVSRRYADSEISSPVGVVANILRDLLRHNNPLTRRCLTIEAFNLAIAYFLRLRDLKSARELFEEIALTDVAYNTDTFNILFLSARHRFSKGYEWNESPIHFISRHLKFMHQHSVPTNVDTWNIILISAPSGTAKGLILKDMQRRNITLSRRGLSCILEDIVSLLGPDQAMVYLRSQKLYTVTIECVNVIVRELTRSGDFARAWRFLNFQLKEWNLAT